jgi:preprotein translocase subunit SecD
VATTPGRIRPWRYLTGFAAIVVVLYALVAFTGDRSFAPKLGIDLQGGTRVTLTARTADGGTPPRDQLMQAQSIIEQRVNGLGVSGAEVVLDGNNITITVPGEGGEQARSLGQTAQLRIRPVHVDPSSGQAAVVPAALQPAPTTGADQGTAPNSGTEQGGTAPTGGSQPQGMGGVVEQDVAPVAYFTPLAQPTPAPTPAPSAPAAGAQGQDPAQAAAIAQAKALRQSTDPQIQSLALQSFDCTAPDPLQGYDDPTLPLVACNQEKTFKYVFDPVIGYPTDGSGQLPAGVVPLEGTEIASAQAGQNQNGVGSVVNLTFKSGGAKTWGDFTAGHIGQQAGFVLDGEAVSVASINSAIYGPTEITGNFNQQQAQNLAGILRYGSLPLSFESSDAQTISATLGLASLEAGLVAGAIGLVLVFIYCLFYYRVLGLLTILSLVLSGAIVYAVLVLLGRWIGFTLDLAGIAGFIVAIGITADSFVIFFERLKDEVREGRSFRSAVPRAWVRARRTILTADAVSFLAAAVLYILAVGQVKGFAFTLGMSTILDLVVVFLVTHPLVALASNSRVFGSPALSGLGAVAKIGAQRRRTRETASSGTKGA